MKSLLFIILAVLVIGGVGLYIYNDRPEPTQLTTGTPAPATGDDDVVVQEVTYYNNVRGYYARPATEAVYPGVVMIHEWWGLNDNIKREARELAAEGYQVLAVDLYNGQVAATSSEARTLSAAVRANQAEAIANLQAATDYIRSQGSAKVASLGWCFGGGQSLSLALSGEQLDATVVYYGTLEKDQTKLKTITQPVLGIFGAEDTLIPVSDVEAFERGLDANQTPNEIYIYPGVGHAFANPSGDNFSPNETADAWQKTLAFLNEHLR